MKRLTLIAILIALMTAGFANAQSPAERPERQRKPHHFSETILSATDMTAEELHQALREDGATLANILENAGVDVDEIIAEIAAEKAAENDDIDEADVIERLTERFNNPRPDRDSHRGDGQGRPPRPQPENAPQDDA